MQPPPPPLQPPPRTMPLRTAQSTAEMHAMHADAGADSDELLESVQVRQRREGGHATLICADLPFRTLPSMKTWRRHMRCIR